MMEQVFQGIILLAAVIGIVFPLLVRSARKPGGLGGSQDMALSIVILLAVVLIDFLFLIVIIATWARRLWE